MSFERKPYEEHHFDFVVIGGGLAGLCCAIAAARKGVKTAIIQDRAVFGGNSSSEIRVVPFGSANFNAWARETGIIEEIILEDRAHNHVDFFEHGMINRNYDMVLFEWVKREPHLTYFLNTSVRGVHSEPVNADDPAGLRQIVAVHGSQLGSEKELVFYARQFADCTGDGTVGFLAGSDWRIGREARSEFDEPMAPITADDVTMGATITMRALDIGRPTPYNPPPWVTIYKTEEEIGPERKVAHIKRPLYGGYWWLEVGYPPYHQIDQTDETRDELLSHVLGVWNWIKNYSPDKDLAKTYVLDWIGVVPGKRESRRLMGDVIVAEKDVHRDQQWPDRICIAGWTIDLHIEGGILNKDEPGELSYIDDHYNHYIRLIPFTLPLRAFYSQKVENLWMAGRNISVTHVAMGATRVQEIHANQGQAVGVAAAYALRCNLTPRQAAQPDDTHVQHIQQELLRDDMHILGVTNQDPHDLARRAHVTATSDVPLSFGAPLDRFVPLDIPRGIVVPITHDRIDRVEFFLNNTRAEAVELELSLHAVTTIWDNATGDLLKTAAFTVPAHSQGWVPVAVDAITTPNHPYRISLSQADGVSWAQSKHHPTGTVAQGLRVSPGGCEPKNRHVVNLRPDALALPPFEKWIQDKSIGYALRITPTPRPYAAVNVNNGAAWPEMLPNLWVSDPAQPLPQHVVLDFGQPRTFDRVLVAFDTNLNLTYTKFGAFWRAPQCARHWRLYAEIDGAWQQIYEETDNYQRRRDVQHAPVTTPRLKLEVIAVNEVSAEETAQHIVKDATHPTDGVRPVGDVAFKTEGRSARIFEIRVYHDGSKGLEPPTA